LEEIKNIGKRKNEVKETARQLLKRLRDNEFKVDRWAEKGQTASAVKKAITDYLFENLPYPAYDQNDIADRTNMLFIFLRQNMGTRQLRNDSFFMLRSL